MSYLDAQNEISRYVTKVERSRLGPDISLGYYHQYLIEGYNPNDLDRDYTGNSRQAGFQVGLSIPLWFSSQQGRVQYAKIQEQISQTHYQYYKSNLQSELYELTQQYQKYVANVEYYEKTGIVQADLILKTADRAFKSGNISYMEYIQSLNRASTIRKEYIEILNSYNQTVIQIESIIGN